MFGPSKDGVWMPFASEIGAEFISGGIRDGWWAGESKLAYHYKDWLIVLDTYQNVITWNFPSFTRVRSPFVTKDGFVFSVRHKNLIDSLMDVAGFKHYETGNEKFDNEFVVNGNNEANIKALFSVSRIRFLISEIREFDLKVNTGEGILGDDFPNRVHELYLRVPEVIKDTHKLRSYIDLFSELLEQLYKIGSADEASPRI